MTTRNTIPNRCNARASYLSMTGGAYCPKHCPPGADPWPALEPRKPCDYAMDDKGAARYVKAPCPACNGEGYIEGQWAGEFTEPCQVCEGA